MDDLIKASQDWIQARPYLKDVGELHIAVYQAIASVDVKSVAKPDIAAFISSMKEGIPLLEAVNTDFLDLEAAGKIFAALVALHENKNLPEQFRKECLAVEKVASTDAKFYEKLLWDLLKGDSLEKVAIEKCVNAELLNFFAWSALRGVLKPYLEELAEAEKAWVFGHCPTCGSEPVTAGLKHMSRGRERFLFCSHCGTSWSYIRIGCPYCDCDDPKDMEIKEIDGEKNFRLDVCNKCNSYVKTAIDKNESKLAREDWVTAHLDILCDDTKYKKHGGLFVWK